MSKPIKIVWNAFDSQAICLPQTLAGAGNLVINGDQAVLNSPVSYFTYVNLERTISFTSTTDLSAINFTIHGTVRGNPSSEVVVGPNNTTVESNIFFTTVTSITASAAVPTNISVGTGTEGHTIWLRSDYQRTVNNSTVQVKVTHTNITYSLDVSVYDPTITQDLYFISPIDGVTIPTIPTATPMINATASSAANFTWPIHSCRVRVSTSDANGSLIFFFLQQGQV